MKIKMLNGFAEAEGALDELALFTAFTIDALGKIAEARKEEKEKEEVEEGFDPIEFLNNMIVETFGKHENGGLEE